MWAVSARDSSGELQFHRDRRCTFFFTFTCTPTSTISRCRNVFLVLHPYRSNYHRGNFLVLGHIFFPTLFGPDSWRIELTVWLVRHIDVDRSTDHFPCANPLFSCAARGTFTHSINRWWRRREQWHLLLTKRMRAGSVSVCVCVRACVERNERNQMKCNKIYRWMTTQPVVKYWSSISAI